MGAVDPAEPVGGITAGEEAAQLLLDVTRESPPAMLVLEAGEERLQVLADEGVERRSRRVAAEYLGPSRSLRRAAPHTGLDGPGVVRLRPCAISLPSTAATQRSREIRDASGPIGAS